MVDILINVLDRFTNLTIEQNEAHDALQFIFLSKRTQGQVMSKG